MLELNDITSIIGSNKIIRHLSQQGCQIRFSLYGINCLLLVVNEQYFCGVELFCKSNNYIESLTWEKISELTLVLSGEKGFPDMNLFISDSDELLLLLQKEVAIFTSGEWIRVYERLLVIQSWLEKLVAPSPCFSKSEEVKIRKNWIVV